MFKISGLDQLTRQLEQAQQAFAEIDGELGTVEFNPHDPASIEAAIQQAEAMIDAKVKPWADNALVAQMVDGMKEQYRTAIIDRAAQARLENAINALPSAALIFDAQERLVLRNQAYIDLVLIEEL